MHLIPVLSYLLQQGRCGHCGWKIPRRYLYIELITIALFLGSVWAYGFTLHAALVALIGLTLLILAAIDLEHFIIPDELQIILALLGIAFVYETERSWAEALMLSVGGIGLALLLRGLMRWWKGREGLGLGDVKFFGVTGLFLTPFMIAPFLFLAGIGGILTASLGTRTKQGIFPFGPALAFALFACVAAPELIITYFNQSVDFLVEFSLHTFNN